MADIPEVKHIPEDKLFVIKLEEDMAFQEYIQTDTDLVITHTEVPKAMEGKGIGSILAKNALKYAEENNLKIMPLCPFMAAYMRKNYETYKHLLAPGFNV
ncbi:GNAT family N-acetyltransferase [Emticicia sp. 21SJ11W-3]|uniref:GNAT family N-acetyltransferase n=1 Tax=Emticicia sp. 21SJ11W-3 TaxID=2916755 RepID=UPI00209DD819|nr:GNAT family N-acetyltransferase [Emticicia sp. 21SJ11W-3]UTA69737.1 N-acetyltransferase [Emticicia sp. 21SJ11W-3]